jgi:hypothetical protein
VALVSPIDTDRLAAQIAGEVITPGHREYNVAELAEPAHHLGAVGADRLAGEYER